MGNSIKPIQKNRVFEDVAAQIREQIEIENWKCGDKIPGEVELSKLFQVSRGSVREAIKSLQILGILEAYSGQGTFVAANALQKINDNKLTEIISDESKFDEILECRYIIETQAAHVAAKACTDEDIEYLEKTYDEMMSYTEQGNYIKYNEYGHKFHTKIVDIMHNEVISAFYASIVPRLREERESFSTSNSMDTILEAHGEHKKLIEAFKIHDADKAREIMIHHLGWKISDKNWK